MAPESMSKSIYSTYSDVYSFSILAYEVLTEESPYQSLEGFELINSIVNKKLRPDFEKLA
jgi:serine/threonine protein kinase